MKIGFDNQKYLSMQSEHIRERINQFDNKLYLEFGGKLFDDYHASRVLPGFAPDSKLQMLMQLADQAEVVIVISAGDIEKNKVRGDLGITYDSDVLRLIDVYKERGLYVGSVVITQYSGQNSADQFKARLEKLGIRVYIHYSIEGYPNNIPLIVSDDGYGKNDYIETTRPLVVVTAPGPGSGKMATCLSQLYHEQKRGIRAGYAKFETFPIWNLPLKHPVNLAYEAATADLNDVNMIDPFHLEAYGVTTVNYNRDVESSLFWRPCLKRSSGKALTNLPLIWASTWRETVSWTMKPAGKPLFRRSSGDILRPLRGWQMARVRNPRRLRSSLSSHLSKTGRWSFRRWKRRRPPASRSSHGSSLTAGLSRKDLRSSGCLRGASAMH